MTFVIPRADAELLFPDYTFISALTPSEQKAAFHIKDTEGKDLCLKIIAPNFSIDRLEREIIALQSLSHTNVVKLIEYTFSTKGGQPRHYMIEEFIEGTDLSDYLISGQSLSEDRTLNIFIPLVEGLSELGKLGIVHRDLKPSNIRIRADETPVIIDFGLARLLNLPDITTTAEGAAIGTPQYFAPEQFTGTKHDIDHRTDLFALGILLYMALVGNHPFFQTGMSYHDLNYVVCNSQDHLSVDKYTQLSHQWRLLIARLLEKHRSRRPSSASQVVKILQKIRGDS